MPLEDRAGRLVPLLPSKSFLQDLFLAFSNSQTCHIYFILNINKDEWWTCPMFECAAFSCWETGAIFSESVPSGIVLPLSIYIVMKIRWCYASHQFSLYWEAIVDSFTHRCLVEKYDVGWILEDKLEKTWGKVVPCSRFFFPSTYLCIEFFLVVAFYMHKTKPLLK